jgi:signal-transduction protein with cAMP-binding, CBS, and nucleotidyltransferase domain
MMVRGKFASKRIIDFAERDFVSLDENILVGEAAKTMYERSICSVIVTRNDEISKLRLPIGIITARDMLHRVIAQNRGPFKAALKDIMSTPLITIDRNASTKDAILLMRSKNITRLPVLNEDNEILGVVSLKSLLSGIQDRDIDTIAA